MTKDNNIKAIFFDVGGVFLTNGWDESSREKLAQEFFLNFQETEKIHNTIFEDFDCGNLTLEKYIDAVYFSQEKERNFSRIDIIQFMKDQSKSFKSTFDILKKLKQNSDYRLATINNESFVMNEFRIEKFDLARYFDNFFSSCYLHMRKPEERIFKTVLHITQLKPAQCLFIDDRKENIEVALGEGINCIHLPKVEKLGEYLKEFNIKF